MNALQSYSSDDESGGEAPTQKSQKCSDPGTNYDDVGMDISEDSDDEQQQNSKANSANSSSRASLHNCAPPEGSPRGSVGLPGSSPPSSKSAADTKDGQRSSLQERLLGLASGGRRLSQDDRSGARESGDSSQSTNPTNNGDANPPTKSRSKSPANKPSKARSPRPRSPNHRSRLKTRSRSKSRERDSGRSSQQGRDHTSRTHISQGHSGRSRDSRDVRRSRDDDRKRRDDERRSRRSRSRSRSRERRRSRSRSRDRRSRSRSRERRRRSRSRDRKRPMDIRKEAQQKLAALKAANPDLTAAELLRRSMEAQVEEVQKQTGITLPSYYNPAAMNPMKFAEQERKKKLLWGNKSKPDGTSSGEGGSSLYGSLGTLASQGSYEPAATSISQPKQELHSGPLSGATGSGQAALWANTKFSNDRDGKMAEKFRRLMGVKNAAPAEPPAAGPEVKPTKDVDLLQKQETMFSSMERQYEMARLATHTHKGFGLGFTSQSFMPK